MRMNGGQVSLPLFFVSLWREILTHGATSGLDLNQQDVFIAGGQKEYFFLWTGVCYCLFLTPINGISTFTK